MMKTLSVLIFVAFCLIGMQNQEELPYKPFKEFNNDTIAFLEYNFHDRAKYYEGKTFEEVYKDLYFTPISYVKYGLHSSVHVCNAIQLTVRYKTPDKGSELYDYYIIISWKEPIDWKEIQKIEKQRGQEPFLPQHYDYFKDRIVEGVSSNPYLYQIRHKR